jgi:hypothetical protein
VKVSPWHLAPTLGSPPDTDPENYSSVSPEITRGVLLVMRPTQYAKVSGARGAPAIEDIEDLALPDPTLPDPKYPQTLPGPKAESELDREYSPPR